MLGTAPLRTEALTWAKGKLYSVHEFGYVGPKGIYELDVSTLNATLLYAFPDQNLDIGGLGFNPGDGLCYGSNDATGMPSGRGIYSFDAFAGAGSATTFVTGYPAGRTDIDGLAVGDGKVYLVEDEAQPIQVYDLGVTAYGTPIATPFTTSTTFSGAGWVPEPASLGLLTAGILLVARRRR